MKQEKFAKENPSEFSMSNGRIFVGYVDGECKLFVASNDFSRVKTLDQLNTNKSIKVDKLNLDNAIFSIHSLQDWIEYGLDGDPNNLPKIKETNKKINAIVADTNKFLQDFDMEITPSGHVKDKSQYSDVYKLKTGEPLYRLTYVQKGDMVAIKGCELLVNSKGGAGEKADLNSLSALKRFEKELNDNPDFICQLNKTSERK